MPAYEPDRGRITFRCSPGLAEAIRALARFRHQSESDLLRQLVRKEIQEESTRAWGAVVQYDEGTIDYPQLQNELKKIAWDNPLTYGFVPTDDGPPL